VVNSGRARQSQIMIAATEPILRARLTASGESCSGERNPVVIVFSANRVRPLGGCGVRVFLKPQEVG
jgi:hypothetical protein